ncbi:MAG TPA: SdrD B-like domain-containing protein [Thermoanaerobaculia bacterium]
MGKNLIRRAFGSFAFLAFAFPAVAQIPGTIQTLDSAGSARSVFANRPDAYLGAGSATTPCQSYDFLSDGTYYFQVTDLSGGRLLSTDPVGQRAFSVSHGVIVTNPAPAHAHAAPTACGSGSISLSPFADAGTGEAAYLVWVTPASRLNGDPNVIDPVCGEGCFHGFRSEFSRVLAFRVEDKRNCQPTFCASGIKFADANGNGVRDQGEAGLGGVEIDFDPGTGVVLSGLTGSDGSFRVCGLTHDATYRVTERPPLGFAQTGPLDHRVSRRVVARDLGYFIEFCDSDVAGLDFGNQLIPNAVGGVKFEDLNANGVRDPGEPPMAGVSISILPGTPANPGPSRTAVTDASGNFLFTNVTPGSFFLVESVPAGFTQTTPASGVITGTLAPGGSFLTAVFGNFRGVLTGAISGLKFLDANGNGVQDPGEGPQSGVTFTISGPAGFTPRTAVSGADGRFVFQNVPFGTYTVTETVPPGFRQTAPPAPGTVTVTLSVTSTTVSSPVFGNQALAQPASISGIKFLDANGNGARDPGEAGAGGVTIRLQGTTPGTATGVQTLTAADGSFTFTGLAAGTYVISEIVPAGFVQTLPGGNGNVTVTVAAGENRGGILFGNQRASVVGTPGSISGLKILDFNLNGIVDGIDRPLEGIVFVLTAADGTSVRATSGPDGTFRFSNVAPGTYVLSEILPSGFAQTFPGTPDAPQTYTIVLGSGQNLTGFLFLNKC